MSTADYNLKRDIYIKFIKCATLSVYGICCFLDLGSFRYVKRTKRLRKHHTCWQWIVFAMCMKGALIFMEIPYVLIGYSLFYFFIVGDSSNLTENTTYYWVHLVSQMAMSTISTLRLLVLTHNSFFSDFFISIVNRVLHMHRIVRKCFGDKHFSSDEWLVIMFLIQVILTLHHIVSQYRPHDKVLISVRYHTVNVILFELFYCSYFLYQLLVLSWLRSLNAFLESYLDLVSFRGFPSSLYARKLIIALDIYTRIGDIHLQVSSAWLKVSSMLFISIYYTAHESTYTLYCLFAMSEKSLIDRIYLVILEKLGTFLYPLVGILLIGTASDRLKHLEEQLCERIFLIELLHAPEDLPILQQFARLISCKHQSFLLQKHSHPIRNFIWNRGSICDRDLVFEIFVYLIINATTFLQFLISDNNSFCEEGI